MIRMRLLEGKDYLQNETGQIAASFGLPQNYGCGSNQGQFFQQLWMERRGGIMVAENDADQIVAWFAFADKQTAEKLLFPTTRANHDSKRLVGGPIVIEQAYRGKGLGTVLAQELIDLGKEWKYHGVEVSCRSTGTNLDPNSENLINAGYVLAEYYPGDVGCMVMEYIWNGEIR